MYLANRLKQDCWIAVKPLKLSKNGVIFKTKKFIKLFDKFKIYLDQNTDIRKGKKKGDRLVCEGSVVDLKILKNNCFQYTIFFQN